MRAATLLVCLSAAGFCQDATFHTTVPAVLAPTTVTDKHGNYIDGLSAGDFLVLDNGVPQHIRLDTPDATNIPLAVVFVVQGDDIATAALLKIQKVGSTVQPLITGDRGHAAVLAYGPSSRLIQDFTSDPEELERAFKDIKPSDSRPAPMLDAVANATTMLGLRAPNERRVIVVIGESRDRGSKTKLDDVVKMIERQSITVFPVVYSAYVTPFTTKGADLPPPDNSNWLDIFTEPARLKKLNAAATLAQSSGGRKQSFATLHSLEQVIGHVGEELHAQYLLSYTPADPAPGFHTITVQLRDRPGAVIRTRPGYWSDARSLTTIP